MTPALTVIMPVRNAAAHLETALASLQQQTLRGFALHVWDDGSDDATPAILDRWFKSRLHGRVIGSQRIGIGPALARLVESATTELVARMDADDICRPLRLEQQFAWMHRHPDVALLGTQVRRIDGDTGQPLSTTDYPTDDAELRWQLRTCTPINHPTVMMRRSAVLACGNYRDLRPGQDDDLWLRLSHRRRLANLPACLLDYREHPASITAKQAHAAQTFRDRRWADAECVFPGLEAQDARRLTRLLTRPDELGVTRQDLALLDQAAEHLAQTTGEPAGYFKQTATFRAQRLNLRIRRCKSMPLLGRAWPIVKRGLKIAQPAAATRDQHTSPQRNAA